MQNDTATGKKTQPSSLCKKVAFKVPSSWGELTQQQLRYIISLLYIYGEQAEGMECVKLWALRYFCGYDVIRKTDAGWLCTLRESGQTFLLDAELLPGMLELLAWIGHPEDMTVRLEAIGEYHAVDMLFHNLPFGRYLDLENYYQYYLQSRDGKYLKRMVRILYQIPEGDEVQMEGFVPLSAFLWFTATKKYFSQVFHHFLKPVADGQHTGTRESQLEMMSAQIRLLTKGDITKNQAVCAAPAYDALVELDALARESEEFNKKYGKTNV